MRGYLYWVIERQNRGGAWEAVVSRAECHLRDLPDSHPFVKISQPNAAVVDAIALLAGGKALPKDTSVYTTRLMTQNLNAGALAKPGAVSLENIRAATENDALLPTSDPYAPIHFSDWATLLEAGLADPAPASLDEVLDWAETWTSNHSLFHRMARGRELLPITGESLRLIVSYENF